MPSTSAAAAEPQRPLGLLRLGEFLAGEPASTVRNLSPLTERRNVKKVSVDTEPTTSKVGFCLSPDSITAAPCVEPEPASAEEGEPSTVTLAAFMAHDFVEMEPVPGEQASRLPRVKSRGSLGKDNLTADWAVFRAAEKGDAEALALSLRVFPEFADAHCGEKGRTPLLAASHHGHAECCRLLLAAGAAPDKCNILGVAPLHVAAANGHVECVTALLDAGASPTLQDGRGQSALGYVEETQPDNAEMVALVTPTLGAHVWSWGVWATSLGASS